MFPFLDIYPLKEDEQPTSIGQLICYIENSNKIVQNPRKNMDGKDATRHEKYACKRCGISSHPNQHGGNTGWIKMKRI